MSEINNYIILHKQNFINEILDLITNSSQQVTGEVIEVKGNNLVLNINSHTIVATNNSSFSFKEGDKVYLSNPKYQEGRLTFKVVDLISKNTKNTVNVSSNDNLYNIDSVKFRRSDIKNMVSNQIETIIKFAKPEDILYIETDKIPSSLLEFAKKTEVFLGVATAKKEGEYEKLIIRVGDKAFEINAKLSKFYFQEETNKEKVLNPNRSFFMFVFDKKKGLILIPKEMVVNKEFKDIISFILSGSQIAPKEEKEFLTILSLILSRRPITKEEFMKERVQLSKFLDKLTEVISDRHHNEGLNKEESSITTKEGFFLFKLLGEEDKVFEQKVIQVLNDIKFNQKQHIEFDFGNFYLNVFNLRLNIANFPFELQFFVNRKKGVDVKVNSVMIRLSTESLGCIGIYIKKVSSNTFKAVIISDILFTLKLIKSKEKELVDVLRERGYKLEIDYKMDDTSSASVIIDFLTFEASIQKIDMKV